MTTLGDAKMPSLRDKINSIEQDIRIGLKEAKAVKPKKVGKVSKLGKKK